MSHTAPVRGPSAAARRVGYTIAALIDAALWFLINVRPGWDVLPFLSGATARVLPLVNASLIVGLAVNLAYLFHDGARFKALGGLVTTGVGLAAIIQVWRVFPFDFHGYAINWPIILRIVLIVGMVGSAIGLLVQFLAFVRGTGRRTVRR